MYVLVRQMGASAGMHPRSNLAHAWVFSVSGLFGTCPERRIFQSKSRFTTLIIDEPYDCSATSGNIPGGALSAAYLPSVVNLHTSPIQLMEHINS